MEASADEGVMDRWAAGGFGESTEARLWWLPFMQPVSAAGGCDCSRVFEWRKPLCRVWDWEWSSLSHASFAQKGEGGLKGCAARMRRVCAKEGTVCTVCTLVLGGCGELVGFCLCHRETVISFFHFHFIFSTWVFYWGCDFACQIMLCAVTWTIVATWYCIIINDTNKWKKGPTSVL